jgi:hypothetical protein
VLDYRRLIQIYFPKELAADHFEAAEVVLAVRVVVLREAIEAGDFE